MERLGLPLSWSACGLLGFLLFALLPEPSHAQPDPFVDARRQMVETQVRRRGIDEPHLLDAMSKIPRHVFVPESKRSQAYDDVPIPIADGQTLSQAFLSALMISALGLKGGERVLEIGTGSGYDAAILSRIASQVYTIEIDPVLAKLAQSKLEQLRLKNVKVRIGDGYRGWSEEAPFDAILLTTAPEHIPGPLLDQLKPGGKMVVAVGDLMQDLQVITKTATGGTDVRKIDLVRLGPMTGEVRDNR